MRPEIARVWARGPRDRSARSSSTSTVLWLLEVLRETTHATQTYTSTTSRVSPQQAKGQGRARLPITHSHTRARDYH